MLKVTVSCLAPMGEGTLKHLHEKIVIAATTIKDLQCKGEDDLMVVFPADMMRHGLGKEIFIEIDRFGNVPWLDLDERRELTSAIGHAVKSVCASAQVRCTISRSTWDGWDGHQNSVTWKSKPPVDMDELKRIQAIVVGFVETTAADAASQCYCESNAIDHKGACHHHHMLGHYTHLMNLGKTALEADPAELPVRADVFLSACAGCHDEFRLALGWKKKGEED